MPEAHNFDIENNLRITTDLVHDHDGTPVPMQRISEFNPNAGRDHEGIALDFSARFRCPQCGSEVEVRTQVDLHHKVQVEGKNAKGVTAKGKVAWDQEQSAPVVNEDPLK